MFMAHEIREMRRALGSSQTAFARLLGVSLSTVRRLETGATHPKPHVIRELQDVRRFLDSRPPQQL